MRGQRVASAMAVLRQFRGEAVRAELHPSLRRRDARLSQKCKCRLRRLCNPEFPGTDQRRQRFAFRPVRRAVQQPVYAAPFQPAPDASTPPLVAA